MELIFLNRSSVLLIVFLLFLNLSGLFAGAETIAPGYIWIVDNVTYGVSTTLSFDNWTLGAHWIQFNGIGFNVTSTNAVCFNFSYFRSHPKSTSSGQMLFNLTTSTTNRNVTFNLNGLKPTYQYMLLNGSSMQARTTSAGGVLQWKHNLTSSHVFTLWDWPYSTPVITETPTNGSIGINRFPRLNITGVDAGLRVTVRFYSNATGGWMLRQMNQSIASGETARFIYTNVSSYSKGYWWKVVTNNSATPNGWTNATYHFTTRASLPTVLLGPSPVNGSIDVPVTAGLSVFIMDPDGDLFNWSITTSPNVGSAGGVNAANGTKTCSVNLSFFTIYYWNVSAVDSSGVWTNASYHFRTRLASGAAVPYYMFVVTARYESNYTVIPYAIVSFGGTIFVANDQGVVIFWKPAGLYRLIAGKAGYATVTQDVVLSADQSLTVYMESGSTGIDALPDVNAVGFIFVALFCVSMVWLKRNRSKT